MMVPWIMDTSLEIDLIALSHGSYRMLGKHANPMHPTLDPSKTSLSD